MELHSAHQLSFNTPKRNIGLHQTYHVTQTAYIKEENHGWNSGGTENMLAICSPNKRISSEVEGRVPCSEGKRGRPRADVINSLIIEGSQSPSSIKCRICNRVFPREKSLQAHLRTHTGNYFCSSIFCS